MNLEFAARLALLRKILNVQLTIDKEFAKEFYLIRKNLFLRKMSKEDYWESYKKALIKSVSQDKQIVSDLIKKLDDQIVSGIEKLEEDVSSPPVDLSVPQ